MNFTIRLTEEQLITLTEYLLMPCIAGRIEKAQMVSTGDGTPSDHFFLNAVLEAVQENLQALLMEPLQDSRFRKTFSEYFEKHGLPAMRELGWPVLQEMLTREV